jgi:hypothetical protein
MNSTSVLAEILIVRLQLAPADETGFTATYHHDHLPTLLRQWPLLSRVRRYEEFGVDGSLRWFDRSFLTIHEIHAGQMLPLSSAWPDLVPPSQKELLRNLEEHRFIEIYRHPRSAWDGTFGSRPFFCVSVQTDPEKGEAFDAWYQGDYLPQTMADVPAWSACRRYRSLDRSPMITHTIYEAENVAGLEEALAGMRAAHRFRSNAVWEQWVREAVTWKDASSFRPIYRLPD